MFEKRYIWVNASARRVGHARLVATPRFAFEVAAHDLARVGPLELLRDTLLVPISAGLVARLADFGDDEAAVSGRLSQRGGEVWAAPPVCEYERGARGQPQRDRAVVRRSRVLAPEAKTLGERLLGEPSLEAIAALWNAHGLGGPQKLRGRRLVGRLEQVREVACGGCGEEKAANEKAIGAKKMARKSWREK
eukprot:6157812-Pleurochrysis_carterae.AAC.10